MLAHMLDQLWIDFTIHIRKLQIICYHIGTTKCLNCLFYDCDYDFKNSQDIDNTLVILLVSCHPWVLPSLITCPPLCYLGFLVVSTTIMSTPIAIVGFAPTIEIGFATSVHVTRVSFTLVNHISFTPGFVFAKFFAMTNLIVACNCSMLRTMAASRIFSTWPII